MCCFITYSDLSLNWNWKFYSFGIFQVYWDVTPCRLASVFFGLLEHEDKDTALLRNVGNCLPVDTA